LRNGVKAAAKFQRILDHPELNPVSVYPATARVNLARTYALQGDAGKARTAHQDSFALWRSEKKAH
jgi:hypothetical protein